MGGNPQGDDPTRALAGSRNVEVCLEFFDGDVAGGLSDDGAEGTSVQLTMSGNDQCSLVSGGDLAAQLRMTATLRHDGEPEALEGPDHIGTREPT